MSRKPERQVKSGRVSISLWKLATKDGERACVQHSRKDSAGDWHNQQIWLNLGELRDLANALDQLNGEEQSSPSSFKVNRILEYIKVNSIDSGLDVFDLQELNIYEVLSAYGIHVRVFPWEAMMIKQDLKNLIERQEFSEIAYCTSTGQIPCAIT